MKVRFTKVLKVVSQIIGGLILLLVLTFLFWLGPTIKLVAHTVGPKALGTDVHIEKLSINPLKGIIRLSDFSIKNPDVFGQTNAVSVASLDISLDMASLFSSTILVHQVELNSPYFIYEQDLSSDNITEFIRNVQAFAKIDPEAPPKPKKEKEQKETQSTPPVVIVESLAINDVRVQLANTYDEKLNMGLGFDSLYVSMTNGLAHLDNFYVENPGRLKSPHLFTLDAVEIQLDPASIYSTNIHFNSVEIQNPHAFVEHNPKTDTLGELLKIVNSIIGKIPEKPATETNAIAQAEAQLVDSRSATNNPSTEISLDTFVIDDVQIHSVNIGNPELDVHLAMSHFSADLQKGAVELNDLHLSNPAHFSTADLFSLEQFAMQLNPESLKEETLVIEEVKFTEPHAFLELHTKFNTVSEFLRMANGYIERIPTYNFPVTEPKSELATSTKSSETQAPVSPPVELHNLNVDDIQIQLLDATPTNIAFPQSTMIAGIETIAVDVLEGNITLAELLVPCPEGFQTTNIFHLPYLSVKIDPESLHTDQTIITRIFIDSPRLDLEQTENSGSISKLQEQLIPFIPTPEQLPQTAENTPAEKSVTPKNETVKEPIPLAEQPLVFHQLELTNLLVNLTLPTIETNAAERVISKLNPLSKKDKPEEETSQTVESSVPEEPIPHTPMQLIAFERLSIEPLKGLISINNLHVSNPPEFSRKNLLELEEFRMDINPDSLQSEMLHIEDILIQKPRIRYERQIKTDNIKALQEEIEAATIRRESYIEDTSETNTPPSSAETNLIASVETNTIHTAETNDAQKVIIDRVLVSGGVVQAKLSALPSIPVPLPTIELTDIGKEKGGASLQEAGSSLYEATYSAIINAVGNATGFAGDTLKGIGALTFDALGNAVGTVSDGVEKATQGTSDVIKGTVDKARSRSSKRRRAGGKRSAAH